VWSKTAQVLVNETELPAPQLDGTAVVISNVRDLACSNTYNNLGVPTAGLSTLPLDPVRTHLVDIDLVSRGSHIVARFEVDVFGYSIAAFVDFRGNILGAHAERRD